MFVILSEAKDLAPSAWMKRFFAPLRMTGLFLNITAIYRVV